MDYSAANTAVWNAVIQFGIIAVVLLFAHFLRRKIKLIEKALMPTAVLAGFILLAIKASGIIHIDTNILEMITYHGITIGFIAMTLQVTKREGDDNHLVGPKSGALIVSTYLVQALAGLAVSLVLFYTIMPELLPASGILLPMGYGQGPGQANNIGTTYETFGLVGGRSFGLSLAAAGYLCACTVGIIYMNFLVKKKGVKRSETYEAISGSVTVETLADEDEMSVSESMDRFSVQIVLVIFAYLLTYLVTLGITKGLALISPGLANTVSSILWGFNFIIGSLVAIIMKVCMKHLRRHKIMHHQYQNNYLLSRISGFAFDIMIVCGIASISIDNIKTLLLPFILMAVLGGVVTLIYLNFMCKKIYKGYEYEGMLSMYGMLTGTISSGVLLLREIDPDFRTPAANNLILGSSFGIAFGAPLLVLIGMAPKSLSMTWIVTALIIVYLILLLLFIFKVKARKKTK